MVIRTVLAFLLSLGAQLTWAAVTVNIFEQGGEVVAEASGTIDTAGLTGPSPGGEPSGLLNDGTTFIAILGNVPRSVYDVTFSSAAPFGPPVFAGADSSSGQSFGIDVSAIDGGIFLPDAYVSGAPITGRSTWTGQTLAGLNLSPGTYSFAWPGDAVTYIISNTPPDTSPSDTVQSVPTMPLWTTILLVILMTTVAQRFARKILQGMEPRG